MRHDAARRIVALALAALVGAGFAVATVAPASAATVIDVTAAPYSAAGDGVTNDRAAIQDALNAAGDGGGATVLLPAGKTFLSGNLTVPSDVTLEIDGTLKQSQNPADYTYTPLLGHGMPASSPCDGNACIWDITAYHNLPFVLAYQVHDVAVEGSGTVQLTTSTPSSATIGVMGIAMSEVDGFTINGLTMTGATNYNVVVWNSAHGTVSDMTIHTPTDIGNTDAISMVNSQHLTITGNTISVGDDAIYVSEIYNDPREYVSPLGGQRWWTFQHPQPSTDIEIADNDIQATPNHALAFLPWAASYPDQSQVEISDVTFHDNVVGEPGAPSDQFGIAVGCYCNDPYNNGVPWGSAGYSNDSPTHYQSPIKDVTFSGDTYNQGSFEDVYATNLKTDYAALVAGRTYSPEAGVSAPVIVNGDFAQNDAWWSSTGDAGAVTSATDQLLTAAAARTQLTQLGGQAGYVQGGASGTSVFEGLGLTGSASLTLPGVDVGGYDLSADVVTSGDPGELYAYDTCTGDELGATDVSRTTVGTVHLSFDVASSCDSIQVGLAEGSGAGADAWALMSDVDVQSDAHVIDNIDPSVSYLGTWGSYSTAGDWDGTHATAMTDGASALIPFTGGRAFVIGQRGDSLGYEDIYVDGTKVATVDTYAATDESSVMIYDTGELPPGRHSLMIVRTGRKDTASTFPYVVFDALVVAPATQTVRFTSTPPAQAAVGDSYVVSASGGASGNPVVFSVDTSSSAVCSVDGATVTFTAVGSCVIDADQAGDDDNAAAPTVQQTVPVVAPTVPPRQPVDQDPVAVDDSAATTPGTAVRIDVLANDTDPDGDQLSLTGVSGASHGAASIAGSTIVYVPARGFTGVDSFTYTISDARGGTSRATVTVAVTPVPVAPVTRVSMTVDQRQRAGGSEAIGVRASRQDGSPAAGVQLTVTVRGANTAAGTVRLDAAGRGVFRYRAAKAGQDRITGAVGAVKGSVVVTILRAIETPTLRLAAHGTGTVGVTIETHPRVANRKVTVYYLRRIHGHKAALVAIGTALTGRRGRAHLEVTLPRGASYVLRARMAGADYVEKLSAPRTVTPR